MSYHYRVTTTWHATFEWCSFGFSSLSLDVWPPFINERCVVCAHPPAKKIAFLNFFKVKTLDQLKFRRPVSFCRITVEVLNQESCIFKKASTNIDHFIALNRLNVQLKNKKHSGNNSYAISDVKALSPTGRHLPVYKKAIATSRSHAAAILLPEQNIRKTIISIICLHRNRPRKSTATFALETCAFEFAFSPF